VHGAFSVILKPSIGQFGLGPNLDKLNSLSPSYKTPILYCFLKNIYNYFSLETLKLCSSVTADCWFASQQQRPEGLLSVVDTSYSRQFDTGGIVDGATNCIQICRCTLGFTEEESI